MRSKISQLLKAAKAYYIDAAPIMTDAEYDKLFQEVKDFETLHGVEDKLTDKVCLGYFEGDKACKVKHPMPMLSVENASSRPVDKQTIITPKIDGAAVELWYVQGKLVRQLTRGDGEYGSDITKILIHNIPTTVPNITEKIYIRGEVYCPNYKHYGKSHRNVVAGSLGKVDFEEDRGLYFIPYWTSLWRFCKTYEDELIWLRDEAKFSPIPYVLANGAVNFSNDFIPNLSYPIDGYVLRYNSNKLYGEKTAHHYKGIWCWKCFDVFAESTINSVTWKSSKNGTWTPVAQITPVEIDDTTISQVNLMHLDYISEKNIAIGDTVQIRKAKGIIPEVVKVLERPADREMIYLAYCPNCGGELLLDGVYLKCTNTECSVDKRIEFFCKTMDIKGLALKNIEKLHLQSPLDLYSFSEQWFADKLGAVGPKVYKEIQRSLNVNVIKLISALNPPNIKQTMLTKIFDTYHTLDVLGDKDKLVKVPGIGEKRADALSNWYRDKFLTYLPILVKIGFNLVPEKSIIHLTIAVTGTFPMTRKNFEELMQPKGVEVKNLTKATQVLVVGEKPSESKIRKAEKYEIPVVSYFQFIQDLKNGSSES